MLRFNDRIYGELRLTPFAKRLAGSCSLLLRLREVRMANIPFFTYPSFANVDRYEHSLGVAHLAHRWARSNGLSDEESEALCLAGLYHDAATPAFGHLFEEFLSRFGFDHEDALVDLLLGRPPGLSGGADAQVFLGRSAGITELLRSPRSADSPLTIPNIAELASGKGHFGRLVKGDMDLDNIDNVIRAATAMGLQPLSFVHPHAVVDSLVFEDGFVKVRSGCEEVLWRWRCTRERLYDAILRNEHEFRAQTAYKWAIEQTFSSGVLATAGAWVLTDPMLTFDHLRRSPFSRYLVDRVRVARPPELLASAWVPDLTALSGPKSPAILSTLSNEIGDVFGVAAFANFYVDKRVRLVSMDVSRQKSLLPHDVSTESSLVPSELKLGRRPGIIGFVGVPREEYARHTGASPRPQRRRRSPADREIAAVIEQVLGQQPLAVASRWLFRLSASTKQGALFAPSETSDSASDSA